MTQILCQKALSLYTSLINVRQHGPLGPLTTNRLTVRLDPERAARIEYWASENPLRIKSYNQLVQEALDEYIDRNTPSPNEKILNVKIPENTYKITSITRPWLWFNRSHSH